MTDNHALVASKARLWGPTLFSLYEHAEATWNTSVKNPNWETFRQHFQAPSPHGKNDAPGPREF
jgi:hypothetical protein